MMRGRVTFRTWLQWQEPWILLGLGYGALIAVAVAGAGCATIRPKPSGAVFPHQDEAAAVVWHTYGRTDVVPSIEWVHVDPGHGCRQGNDAEGFRTVYGECVGGVTYSDGVVSSVEPIESFCDTALAHEFQHAARMRDGNPAFATHDAMFFKMVAMGNAAMFAAGYCGKEAP